MLAVDEVSPYQVQRWTKIRSFKYNLVNRGTQMETSHVESDMWTAIRRFLFFLLFVVIVGGVWTILTFRV